MAHNSIVAALVIMAVVIGLASAQGPSTAPAYAPAKSSIAAAPTKASTALIVAPSISDAPESSTFSDIASPPAPGSQAAEGPTGDFSTPAPIANNLVESPESAGAALKVSAVVMVVAVVGSLLL